MKYISGNMTTVIVLRLLQPSWSIKTPSVEGRPVTLKQDTHLTTSFSLRFIDFFILSDWTQSVRDFEKQFYTAQRG